MKKPKVYLGTIFIDRGAVPAFYYSLAELAHSRLLRLRLSPRGHGDGAMRQLNRRCAEFLDETTDEYFWLQGNDTDFRPAYIRRLASHGLPMVCGLVPIKEPALRWGIQKENGTVVNKRTGLLEVRASLLECMMIHRDVLVAMRKARPDLAYRDNFHGPTHRQLQHHFWRWELRDDPGAPGEKFLQSEDYLFCDIARDLGFKIHVDLSGFCGHWDGRTRYPLEAPDFEKLKHSIPGLPVKRKAG
jgi:hypothetical protein